MYRDAASWHQQPWLTFKTAAIEAGYRSDLAQRQVSHACTHRCFHPFLIGFTPSSLMLLKASPDGHYLLPCAGASCSGSQLGAGIGVSRCGMLPCASPTSGDSGSDRSAAGMHGSGACTPRLDIHTAAQPHQAGVACQVLLPF